MSPRSEERLVGCRASGVGFVGVGEVVMSFCHARTNGRCWLTRIHTKNNAHKGAHLLISYSSWTSLLLGFRPNKRHSLALALVYLDPCLNSSTDRDIQSHWGLRWEVIFWTTLGTSYFAPPLRLGVLPLSKTLKGEGGTQDDFSRGGGPCEGLEKRWRTTTSSDRDV